MNAAECLCRILFVLCLHHRWLRPRTFHLSGRPQLRGHLSSARTHAARQHLHDASSVIVRSDERSQQRIDVHFAFHEALVSTRGSPRLMQIRTTLYEQTERYRRLELNVPQRNRDVANEHRQFAEAAIARDVATAARLMHDHINRTTEGIIRALSDSAVPKASTAASPKRAATGSRTSRAKAPAAAKATPAAKAPAKRRTATASKKKSA
ncbi:FCD domain-containing protein [Paraburkholderia sp. HP33-1]|uniref:FCD domain-containing protein n=1 Tax=Paraburkholderia sp. HP33-1 TaxID=2883243 RepID=UPI001F41B1F0|nr:FCD domain-containing protein [Paraburkholderia sp. HP33-1]